MLPVVAIIGRPNVGKSTLFNRLTGTRDALITAYPGTTRDRQYGEVHLEGRHFIIIDTGGITEKTDEIGTLITEQTLRAIEEADQVLFLIDAKTHITPEDRIIADILRRLRKAPLVLVNKAEGLDPAVSILDAYELALGTPIPISAAHGLNITELIEALFPLTIPIEGEPEKEISGIKLAIVGRPNVGKSTLVNRLLGDERVIVHDTPHTTRDSIYIPLKHFDTHYTLIDTAGVRKRKQVSLVLEKFSIVKTLQAIENAHVVLYVMDGRLGATEQDLKLLGFVLECGKGLVIAINKWDGMREEERAHVKATIDRHLNFVTFARIHYISALHGFGVLKLFDSVNEAYQSAMKELSTSELTQLLKTAVTTHSPPLIHGRRVKLRYAHPGGHNPPRIIIHGNQVDALPESYRKFLAHFFQKRLNLYGTPVYVEFKTSKNPFKKQS